MELALDRCQQDTGKLFASLQGNVARFQGTGEAVCMAQGRGEAQDRKEAQGRSVCGVKP